MFWEYLSYLPFNILILNYPCSFISLFDIANESSSLKNVTRAHEDININPDDVEELIDKLETFQEDFEEISEQLNESMTFNINITDEELEEELLKEQESVTKQSEEEEIEIELPEINVSNKDSGKKHLEGSMDREDQRYRATTTYA